MKQIPNLLSALRIFMIPVFVYFMYAERTLEAAVVLATSGITDLLDGFIARRFNCITQLGKVLDPAADKLTQVAVCLVLLIKLHDYWYFFAIMLTKEIIMLILSGYLIKKQVKLDGSRWFGKLGTALFYVCVTIITFIPEIPFELAAAMLAATTLCSLGAAFMYIPEFMRYRRQISGAFLSERPNEQ